MRHISFSKTQFLGVNLLVTIFLATYNGGCRGATALPATAAAASGAGRLFDALVDATDMSASAREFAELLRASPGVGDDEIAVDVQIKIPANEGFPFMGCGLVARVRGDRGTALSADVPGYQWVGCDGTAHRIRALWQNATYGARFRLPARERPVAVEIGIDDHATAQRGAVCVGLRDAAAGARARAFCVDDGLLVACDQLNSGRPDAHYADAANVWPFFGMSRASDSTAKIVFRDVHALLGAFEALAADARDTAARSTACGLIDTVRGASAPDGGGGESPPDDRAKCRSETRPDGPRPPDVESDTDADDRFVSLKYCSEIVPLPTAP